MNRVLVLLVLVSLGGNAALLVKHFRPSAQASPRSAAAGPVDVDHAVEARAASLPASIETSTGAAPVAAVWAQVGSADMRTLAANLRAIGLPEVEIRAIVVAMLVERQAQRYAAFRAETGPRPYWQIQRGDGLSPEQRAELRDMGREREALVRELFGTLPLTESERRARLASFGPLPAEKIEAIGRVNADYSDITSEVYRELAAGGGSPMPWDREKMALIESERRKDIEAALTPEEQEIYKLYGPGVASAMRSELAGFEPTEAEFRAIHAIRAEIDPNQGGMMMFMDSTQAMSRRDAQAAGQEKIKAALGEARYADYMRVTDAGYKRAAEITARFNLPASNATAAYEVGRDIQARATAIRADTTLSRADRAAAFAALAGEANNRLSTLLTPTGVEIFKTSGGSWLRNIESQGGAR